MNRNYFTDTIAAIATPPGKGGVGIVRISGPKVAEVAFKILGRLPQARQASFLDFKDQASNLIDQGIAIYFKAPHSFTGEDILELQAHGGPIILDQLMKMILVEEGIRIARPGEFSERAYLNEKLDLVQAEAISDLINASTEQAAKAALKSLQGEFSKEINLLLAELTQLRIFVEASIDFPDEEIDFIKESTLARDLTQLMERLNNVFKSAHQGSLLQEGISAVIVGQPNAGKSSLLNALSGKESAIVTEIAGTTRDVLREQIHIDGMPLHIIDTAGLRDSEDPVEQEGIRRAQLEIEKADVLLLVIDATQHNEAKALESIPQGFREAIKKLPMVVIKNKIDLLQEAPAISLEQGHLVVALSAKHKEGIDLLKQELKEKMGYEQLPEGSFSARRRHLESLGQAQKFLEHGEIQLKQHHAYELLADDLREAQKALSEITGEFTADELLGKIFSSFCIGK